MLARVRQVILVPPNWLPKADGVRASNFADYRSEGGSNRYWNNGLILPSAAAWWASRGGTFARASSDLLPNLSGILTTFGTNVAANPVADFTTLKNLGRSYQGARTGIVLWNRDLTNGAWTASNITAAKDQTGIDGVSNAASSLTATANNGTIFQSITTASTQRAQAAYVKRITGSGTVSISMDGGSTYTDITSSINSSTYTRVPTGAGLVQTLANPNVGFKLGTSGDKIAVDFFTNEAGAFVSSPTLETTGSVSRAADSQSVTRTAPTSITKVIAGRAPIGGTNNAFYDLTDGAADNNALELVYISGHIKIAVHIGGVTTLMDLGAVANNTDFVVAFSGTSGSYAASLNGGTVVTSAAAGFPAGMVNEVEGNYKDGTGPLYSTIAGSAEWTNFAASNVALQALSGSSYWN